MYERSNAFRRSIWPVYNRREAMADRDETIELLGKYEIKRPLGRGAMGTVYEGWDPIIARRVAIKTVRCRTMPMIAETEEALARFRREAQAAGRLTHPNIVGVFDYGETDDLAYIVMEFVDGPPLKTLLDKQERFALADALRVMEDLLAGLQFSHERGVVHRDIKPANVMLTSGGQAKIADFGIARIESSSMTQAGTLLGTPAYMSPEQFMGQVVDARTDIYSSGVLLYQLLTGERPFEGGMSAIMHKALNTEPPAPSQLSVTAPPAFDAVVRRAMAKRPEDRYASAAAFCRGDPGRGRRPTGTGRERGRGHHDGRAWIGGLHLSHPAGAGYAACRATRAVAWHAAGSNRRRSDCAVAGGRRWSMVVPHAAGGHAANQCDGGAIATPCANTITFRAAVQSVSGRRAGQRGRATGSPASRGAGTDARTNATGTTIGGTRAGRSAARPEQRGPAGPGHRAHAAGAASLTPGCASERPAIGDGEFGGAARQGRRLGWSAALRSARRQCRQRWRDQSGRVRRQPCHRWSAAGHRHVRAA